MGSGAVGVRALPEQKPVRAIGRAFHRKMAWNRNDSSNQRDVGRGRRGVPFVLLVAFVSLALVFGITLWWAVRGGGDAGHATLPTALRGGGRIAEAKPAAAPRSAEPATKPSARALTKEERDAEFIRRCEAKYGANMPPGLKTHIYYLKNPPKVTYEAMVSHKYLKHTSERDIASVLLVAPGTAFLEPTEYGDEFDRDFMSAMLDPIKPEEGDTEEVRHNKELVSALKKEIAELVKSTGRKPSDIMTEQSRMMYELGLFEKQLADDLLEAENNPDLSDADVDDLFAAANILRKKKGLPEHAAPDLTKRTLRLKREMRRREREERRRKEMHDQPVEQ